MKPFAATTTILAIVAAESISYDPGYDDGSRSMNVIACSDGGNGLETRFGWQTQGQIPSCISIPYIGGSIAIGGWNSPVCGVCYAVTYNGVTVHMLGIDTDGYGLSMSETAMNRLTNGQAVQLGRIDAQVEIVSNPPYACGQ